MVGLQDDNLPGVSDGILCPEPTVHVVMTQTISPLTGPDYDVYRCEPGSPATSGLTRVERRQIQKANQAEQECLANPNSAACY